MKDDIIKQLYFKYELNKRIADFGFDAIVEDLEFLSRIAEFKTTKIGKIWLSKPFGKAYIEWNNR